MAVFNDLLVKGPAKFLGGIDGNLTASSSEKLTTSAGSATQPVYFSDGKPVACTYTLGKSVPSNAVFTDTDTKVTNTLATTTKAYVTGTTSSSTNTGTQVFDTEVYLDTTAGMLTATTFKGSLSGNASTATKLATARTISLTGSVTGSGTFDGSGNLSIATKTNHSHSYLPLSGGTLTGLLTLAPAGSTTEGGEIRLAAPANNTAQNGIVLDSYSGVFRIFGIPSADGSSKTGNGTVLTFDPYNKNINGNWNFYGVHAHSSSASDYFSRVSIWQSDGVAVASDYYRNSADNTQTARYMRVYTPGAGAYSDLRISVTSSLADWNVIGAGVTTQLRVNNNLVYHVGYKPYVTGTFTSPSAGSSVTVKLGFQPSCAFVWTTIAGNRQLWAAQTITATGFTFINTEDTDGAGLVPSKYSTEYIAFR